jgi:peptide/nickel transport system permease protein
MRAHGLGRYLAVRFAWALVTVAGLLLINFLVMRLVPGDPALALVGEFPVPPDYVENVRRSLGLDQPLSVQLWLYFANLARGELGFSFVNRVPVIDIIFDRAGYTLLLMLPALTLASIVGVVLSLLAAPRAGGKIDGAVTALNTFGYSVPIFWLGQVLVVIFVLNLGWLPAQGMTSLRAPRVGFGYLTDVVWHMVLPVFCIMTHHVAVIARVARASVLEALHQDFVLTARGKGLSRRSVLWRHVLPNALLPVITIVGYSFGHSLTGAILVETVFSWPGLGQLFITSITTRDYPVLQGIFLLTATVVVCVNLFTDVLYAFVDPRVRLGRGNG